MTRIHLLSLIVGSIILMPWIPMPEGMPQVRPECLVILAGLVIFPVSIPTRQQKVLLWGIFVIASYLFSMAYGVVFLRMPIVGKDFYTVISPLVFLLFFVLAVSGSYSVRQYRTFLRVTQVTLAVSAVVAVIQFFNPDWVSPFIKFWTDEKRISMYVLKRATGTMGNPNDLGFLMVTGFALTLFTIRHQVLPWLLHGGILVLLFAAVFATGSRTAMVCLAAVVAAFLLIEIRTGVRVVAFAAITIAAIILIFQEVVVGLELFEGLVGQVTSFQSLDEVDSWQQRVQMARETLPLIAQSWIVGRGPAKEVFELGGNVDNEYILILYRFGLLGLSATVGFVWTLAMQLSKRRTEGSPLLCSMRNFALASTGAAAIFAYSAGIFMSFRLFGLLVLLWTVAARVHIAPSESLEPRRASHLANSAAPKRVIW